MTKTRRELFRLLLLALLALSAACSKTKRAPERAVAHRVVSLSPSTTEAVFAVGAGAKLVGRSRYCNHPSEALLLPQVGGIVDPSLEAILALRPDLVVGARGPAGRTIADKLEARGVATYFPETESLAGIEAMLLGLGERTGHAAEAGAAAAELRERLRAVSDAVAPLPKPRVLVVFGLSPLSVAGPASFVDEMITRAGGVNVVTEGGAYPTLGFERALALDPDVIVNAAMMEERATDRLNASAPGWRDMRAAKDGRIVTITDEAMLRPGPRVGDGIAELARALHPDVVIPSPDGGE